MLWARVSQKSLGAENVNTLSPQLAAQYDAMLPGQSFCAVCLRASYLSSLDFSLLIYKVGMVVVPTNKVPGKNKYAGKAGKQPCMHSKYSRNVSVDIIWHRAKA